MGNVLINSHTGVDGSGLVTINGAKYSIEEAPPESSRIVEEQMKIILKAVNLKALVKDLTKVGQYIHIASMGVTAAGHTDLQIEVQRIGISVATLGRKSHTAVNKFRLASTRILESLQTTYHFLLLGKEESAIRILEGVTEEAKDMSAVALDLQVKFETETQNVRAVLEQTMQVRGLEKEKRKKIALQLKEFDILKQKADVARKHAIEAEKKHWKLFEDARRKHYKALKKKSNPFKMIVNAFTSAKFGFSVFGDGTNKEMAEAARDEKLTHLKYVYEQQAIQQEAAQRVAEFMMRIENCKDSSQLADIAIDALQSAVSGLNALSVVMMRAAEFWEQMHTHVESMRKSKFVDYVKEMMSNTKEERKQEWNSRFFLESGVRYCAQWVALYRVCTQYMMELEHVQEGVYYVLKDNPNEKEALAKLKVLVKKYRKEMEKDLRGIEDQSSKVDKEIKQLEQQKKESDHKVHSDL